MDSQEYENNMMVFAKKAFVNHTMKNIVGNHWVLYQPNTNIFRCDIIVVSGSIIVYGDIDICCFAYYSGDCSEAAIEWMSKGVGSYEREKALIGMGHIGVDDYNSDVAIHDLKQRIKDAREEYGDEWNEVKEKYEESMNLVIKHINYGDSFKEIHQMIYDKEFDSDAWEWISSIGRVISPRVIYALAAIQRLNELIKGI